MSASLRAVRIRAYIGDLRNRSDSQRWNIAFAAPVERKTLPILESNAVETPISGTRLAKRWSNRGMNGRYRHIERSCPQCGDTVLRVHRRVIDRLYSLFHPIHRYQCTSLECGWQGNLPRGPMVDEAGLAPLSTPTGTR